MKVNWDFIGDIVGVLLILTAFVAVILPIVLSARADGKVDHCYIDSSVNTGGNTSYVVVGHRPWRQDVIVYRTTVFEEAQKIAAQCAK